MQNVRLTCALLPLIQCNITVFSLDLPQLLSLDASRVDPAQPEGCVPVKPPLEQLLTHPILAEIGPDPLLFLPYQDVATGTKGLKQRPVSLS